MRIRASLGAATLFAVASVVVACGLDMGGLQTSPLDGGGGSGGLDGPVSAEGAASSSGTTSSSGSTSGSSGGTSSGSGSTGSTSSSTSGSGGTSSSGADATVDGPGSSGGGDSSAPDSPLLADSSQPDVVTGGPDAGCTAATGCYVIPGGWQLVAFAPSQSTACPSGFNATAPQDVGESPQTGSACQCGCTVSKQPTCPTGPIATHFDVKGLPGAGSCQTVGAPPQNNNSPAGQCATDMYTGPTPVAYTSMELAYTPPGATGGQCSSFASPTGSVSFNDKDRVCASDSPQPACNGNECTVTLPSPYLVCVSQAGTQACPGAPFTVQHVAGTGATVTCGTSGCNCNLAVQCTGTMKLFTDNKCSKGELDVAADGNCHDPKAPSGTYASYEYAANAPQVQCQSSGTATAQSMTLQNPVTICCTQ